MYKVNNKTIIFTISILCVLLIVSGCGELNSTDGNAKKSPDDNESPAGLTGTSWKLVGIVDTKTGTIKELAPKDCEACYTLWFDTDFTFSAINITSRWKLDLRSLNPNALMNDMLHCERYDKNNKDYCDSDKFWRSLLTTESWSVTDEELKLFTYGGFSYLLFTPHDGDNPSTSVRGTKWKLLGMVDVQTDEINELYPKDCAECYMLDFFGDYRIGIRSLWATTIFDLLRLERVDNPPPSGWQQGYVPMDTWTSEYDTNDEIHDAKAKEDSYIFRYSIDNVKSYEITSNELKLFFVYNEKNFYLLFKLVYL